MRHAFLFFFLITIYFTANAQLDIGASGGAIFSKTSASKNIKHHYPDVYTGIHINKYITSRVGLGINIGHISYGYNQTNYLNADKIIFDYASNIFNVTPYVFYYLPSGYNEFKFGLGMNNSFIINHEEMLYKKNATKESEILSHQKIKNDNVYFAGAIFKVEYLLKFGLFFGYEFSYNFSPPFKNYNSDVVFNSLKFGYNFRIKK